MSAPFDGAYRGLNVLVTGNTGFKGSWLSLWLSKLGAKVTGFSIDVPTNPSLFELAHIAELVDHRFGDVGDFEAIKRLISEVQPDLIFHLAAQPLVRLSYREPLATLATNVMGTANLLDAVRTWGEKCDVVVVTSDKCYHNDGRIEGYRETDPMGGYDPYSMSKGAAELVVDSWRNSYFRAPDSSARVASGRAGNVIGGGDWAADRIITDCIAALTKDEPIGTRNPLATRPWQHVLEPLSGYLLLGSQLRGGAPVDKGWNFGPDQDNIRNVQQLVDTLLTKWGSGSAIHLNEAGAPKEAIALSLNIEKARTELDWFPVWEFDRTIAETAFWYRKWFEGADIRSLTDAQIDTYMADAAKLDVRWARPESA
ncbi:CDP-glucose 4,6-dehydratase [Stakelama marina]|uniref:CDP-glucose 4,6-dehydratase n=1 Tax=Stakelama marina TaxID=2826939 RepID=A0A8T4IBR6_9SPHN|nr:CDP-glucose 4,6-dehydratase [Stakelama marina]MBR0552107.1 CDP-glucose 4,6-dehydratase [Stakelama marina]